MKNESQHPDFESQKKRIEELEKLHEAAEKRAVSFESNWSAMFDQHKTLREEHQQLQLGYENLRIQKGGFGFKMLLASGFGGFFTAALLCFVYLKLKPQPDYVRTFTQFRQEMLFDYELSLSKGEFETVESSLLTASKNEAYKPIQAEIQFTHKIVGAAKRYCQQKE